MTEECYGDTYFGAQHILDPANNSSWAWHTVAAMLAILDYPKSWAHLATLPLKPDRVVRSRGRSGMGSNIAWHRRHNDSVD